MTLADEKPNTAQPPPGVTRVNVCTASGELPNRWCPQTAPTWFIPGKSPIRVSTLHRPVTVDIRTGLAACPPSDPNQTRLEVFEFWPSDVQRLFRRQACPAACRPDPLPAAPSPPLQRLSIDPPRLRSPLAGVVYTLRLSRPDETIGLQASLGAGSETMYWFAGIQYLGVFSVKAYCRGDRGVRAATN